MLFNSINSQQQVVLIDEGGNKVTFNVTDEQLTKVYTYLKGGKPVAAKPSTKLSMEPEKKENAPMVGKKVWQEDFLTVTEVEGVYRVYLTVPALIRKKGENDEKKARERAQFIKDKLKEEAKALGAKWAGDYDKRDFFWEFETKTGAQKYIKSRKAYTAEREA